jgi:hypothetical protein
MVRIHPDPPTNTRREAPEFQQLHGAIAQLGERLLCKQEVTGSIPVGSTRNRHEARGTRGNQQSISLQRGIDWCFFNESSIGCSLTIWD